MNQNNADFAISRRAKANRKDDPYPCLSLLKKHVYMSHLLLEQLDLTEICIKLLVSSLSSNCEVKILSLASNKLTANKIDAFLSAKFSPCLKKIVFKNNRLGDEGISTLQTLLRNHPHISYLDISENGVGDLGIDKFVAGILSTVYPLKKKMRNFPVLRVSNNRFTTVGLKACLRLCILNSSVKILDISGNIQLESVQTSKILACFLRINKTVKVLDLRNSSVKRFEEYEPFLNGKCAKMIHLGNTDRTFFIKPKQMLIGERLCSSMVQNCTLLNYS